MKVSGWKSGKSDAKGRVAFGVRVGKENANRFFEREWDVVLVEMDGETFPVKVTKTFWTTCPELRNPAIGAWLKKKGLERWQSGRPPRIRLTPISKNRFRLEI